ncbi:MAG: sortase [Christensenellales bacterium]|jgi:LPXTG-site transpeptidase (sortase) family protein
MAQEQKQPRGMGKRIFFILGIVTICAAVVLIAFSVLNIWQGNQRTQESLLEAEQLIAEMGGGAPSSEGGLTAQPGSVGGQDELAAPNDESGGQSGDQGGQGGGGGGEGGGNAVMGILVFDSLGGLRVPIIAGATPYDLTRGAGHYSKSVLPGQSDNCLVFGHRDTVFKDLGRLAVGDTVTVLTVDGSYTYRLEQTDIVEPLDPLIYKSYNSAMLTLVTCYPFNFVGSAPQRYVVVASLVQEG